MRRIVRENAAWAFAAGAASAIAGWLCLYGFGWNDYETEVRPAYEALVHGHLMRFLQLAPAYGGSLIERAPFALLANLWGGGPLAVYRLVALPCLLAACVLGVWLVSRMRRHGSSTLAKLLALGVCVLNPITFRALELGHPEELLGACLCVAAVLLAARSRAGREHSVLAGFLLGLAVANKDWALLASGPVLLAVPPGRRLRCLASAGVTGAVLLVPLALLSSGGFVASTRAVATPSAAAIFKPWQLWWFFGHYSPLARGPLGVPQVGYRIGPAWASAVSHPLILATAPALALALWPRSRRSALSEHRALLALALVMLLRCVLDTWDESYYLLPFLLAILAWEIVSASPRAPLFALACSLLGWLSFQWLEQHASADIQASVFLAWSVPLALWLALRLFSPNAPERVPAGAPEGSRPGYETTVSALGRLVKTS
ncbi:MAG: glycosyltransferase 87 family protein [Solirubrobacteraceae bacterium]